MEKFVEILKVVGKFLTIFIAKIIYYLVKGCIAFGRYCVIGFGIARKYVVKFIKEKQWRVITDKFGSHKTPAWNPDKKEKPAVSDHTREYNYTPEESMNRAYRMERPSTPVVDPGHHADKNKVVVKAIDETPSFNGSIIVKESSASLKPAPATPAPAMEEKEDVQPSPVVEVSNEEPESDFSYQPIEEQQPVETVAEVQEEISAEPLEAAEPVVEDIDLQPSEPEPELEPADILTTNISFGGEDEESETAKEEDAPAVDVEDEQPELSTKITFDDINFVEPSEEEKTDEPSAEPAPVVNTVVEEPQQTDFVVAEKEEPEVVNKEEETAVELQASEEKSNDDDFPFAPMDDALDFSDAPVDEPSVIEPEPTLDDLFSTEEPESEEKPTPSANSEQVEEHSQDNEPAPKQEPKKSDAKAKVEKELDFEKDQYTEGSLFGF